jgi:hypothetical protein
MEVLSAKEQKKRSQDIDKMLRNEKKKLAKQTTLLMLGSGQVLVPPPPRAQVRFVFILFHFILFAPRSFF